MFRYRIDGLVDTTAQRRQIHAADDGWRLVGEFNISRLVDDLDLQNSV